MKKYLFALLLIISCGAEDPYNCVSNGENCKGDKGDKGDPAPPAQSCKLTKIDSGAVLECPGYDPLILENGKNGSQGAAGKDGADGKAGKDGKDGKDGASCTVASLSNGARISCPDGTEVVVLNGTNGVDGQDSTPTAYSVASIIDPCGPSGNFDEVLLKLYNGKIMAHYADGAKQFLTFIGPGNYVTTDYQSCRFTVNNDMTVTW